MATDFKACVVPDCKSNAHWSAGGSLEMCRGHYMRSRRYGSHDGGTHRHDNNVTCSAEGCTRKARTMLLCDAHYQRLRWSGSIDGTGKALRGEPAEYLSSVAMVYEGDDCLIWPFSRNAAGYATMFAKKGDTTIVSRAVCEMKRGRPPSPDHDAAHSCGKGHEGCINPHHLRWATKLENAADKFVHGTLTRKP